MIKSSITFFIERSIIKSTLPSPIGLIYARKGSNVLANQIDQQKISNKTTN